MKCLRMLTFLPLEQIDEMDKLGRKPAQQAKEILAYELTASWCTAEEEAEKAQDGGQGCLFGGGGDYAECAVHRSESRG